jgi:alkylated DNA nucleotide flippase Atl1
MHARLLDTVTVHLNSGWAGTYGELAKLCGSHARAVGAAVRAYARRHPTWPHARVYAKRTGRPAYEP